jgi:hypothetical protein
MQPVKDAEQTMLREKKLMTETEVAYVQGDLLVVVNAITNDRRVLGNVSSYLNESVERKILKG